MVEVQHVNQRPTLGVKHAGARAFVVERGIVAHRQQRVERDPLL